MLSDKQFMQLSLINNLFYLRKLKSYSVNIQLSFYQNNQEYIQTAISFGEKCDELSRDIIKYVDYELLKFVLENQIIVTKYTLETERLTEKLFGIDFATDVTEQELFLQPGKTVEINSQTINAVAEINRKAKTLTENFILFCQDIYNGIKSNQLFSYLYSALYQHMIEEIRLYQKELDRLEIRQLSSPIFVVNFEYNFNKSMKSIAMFLRGFVDPTEEEIFSRANQFVEEFNTLVNEYSQGGLNPEKQKELTQISLDTLNRFILFIETCIERRLLATVYFIVEPTFLDTVFRDANYFKYGLAINQLVGQNF